MKIFGIASMIVGGFFTIVDIWVILGFGAITQEATVSAISTQVILAVLGMFYVSIGYKAYKSKD
jgi:hypothetical protein